MSLVLKYRQILKIRTDRHTGSSVVDGSRSESTEFTEEEGVNRHVKE
jgi:hypothetical protein